MSELAEFLAYTTAPGIARVLHINKAHGDGFRGFLLRFALFAYIFVPLVLGLAEISIGIAQRNAGSGCSEPLAVWLIVDGIAALLTAILSIVEVARVHSHARDDDEDDSHNARLARATALGPYAWIGLFIIFIVPLFRLCWLLWAVDIIFRIGSCWLCVGLARWITSISPVMQPLSTALKAAAAPSLIAFRGALVRLAICTAHRASAQLDRSSLVFSVGLTLFVPQTLRRFRTSLRLR